MANTRRKKTIYKKRKTNIRERPKDSQRRVFSSSTSICTPSSLTCLVIRVVEASNHHLLTTLVLALVEEGIKIKNENNCTILTK